MITYCSCLLYTSDAADERSSVDLGGRRIITTKNVHEPEVSPVDNAPKLTPLHRTTVALASLETDSTQGP